MVSCILTEIQSASSSKYWKARDSVKDTLSFSLINVETSDQLNLKCKIMQKIKLISLLHYSKL